MSFIGDLFGGGSSAPAPATPAPLQATPTISDAASQSAAIEERARLKNRMGVDRALLTPGLGDTSYSPANVTRTSALGGGAATAATSGSSAGY